MKPVYLVIHTPDDDQTVEYASFNRAVAEQEGYLILWAKESTGVNATQTVECFDLDTDGQDYISEIYTVNYREPNQWNYKVAAVYTNLQDAANKALQLVQDGYGFEPCLYNEYGITKKDTKVGHLYEAYIDTVILDADAHSIVESILLDYIMQQKTKEILHGQVWEGIQTRIDTETFLYEFKTATTAEIKAKIEAAVKANTKDELKAKIDTGMKAKIDAKIKAKSAAMTKK